MFIGHYKSVNSQNEFYSSQRDELDFPTQVIYNNERYSITRSIQVTSKSQYEKIIAVANSHGIAHGIKVD